MIPILPYGILSGFYVSVAIYITAYLDTHTHTHTDIDECTAGTDECGDDSTCLNNLGTYLCRCNRGFKKGSSRFECEGKDPPI